LLALCLRRLSGASGCPEVHIYADTAAKLEDIAYVRDEYFPTANIFHAKPHLKVPSGCWNILNAIKDGSRFAEDVYIVEEDVMVYPYFFQWHKSQTTPASCGRKTPFNNLWPNAYTNPGSCLRRALLDKLVPHINDDYFTRLKGYLNENFPVRDEWSDLDDGLIRRLVGDCAYPETPVCAHQGFYFYDKIDIFTNNGANVEERIARFLELEQTILTSQDWHYARYAKDFEPFSPSKSPQ
jgi:hypothetical protein